MYKGMPYQDILNLDKQSRCILEVVQDGGYSPTSRWAEAMLLHKKLLTNCPALCDCDDHQIIYFDHVENINFDKIRCAVDEDETNWKEEFSVSKMIRSIKAVIQVVPHG